MHDGIVEQTGDAARAVRPPGQHVRRRLHRLAGDEHDSRHRAPSTARRAHVELRRRRDAAAARRRARAPTASAVLYGIRPEHCARGRRRRACRSTSSSSSRRAPTRSSIAASTARKSRRWCATASIARAGERDRSSRPTCRAPMFSTRRAASRSPHDSARCNRTTRAASPEEDA